MDSAPLTKLPPFCWNFLVGIFSSLLGSRAVCCIILFIPLISLSAAVIRYLTEIGFMSFARSLSQRQRLRLDWSSSAGNVEDEMVVCHHEGCTQRGVYPIPCRPHHQDLPVRLRPKVCLTHARLLNQQWNYYQGFSSFEIETDQIFDRQWRRPTSRSSPGVAAPSRTSRKTTFEHQAGATADNVEHVDNVTVEEELRKVRIEKETPFFTRHYRRSRTTSQQASKQDGAPSHQRQAPQAPTSSRNVTLAIVLEGQTWDPQILAVLGISLHDTLDNIKKAYKTLVKRLHPDSRKHQDDQTFKVNARSNETTNEPITTHPRASNAQHKRSVAQENQRMSPHNGKDDLQLLKEATVTYRAITHLFRLYEQKRDHP